MKYRQAKKICDRITTADLIYEIKKEAIIVIGIRSARYNWKQFTTAFRVMRRRFSRI